MTKKKNRELKKYIVVLNYDGYLTSWISLDDYSALHPAWEKEVVFNTLAGKPIPTKPPELPLKNLIQRAIRTKDEIYEFHTYMTSDQFMEAIRIELRGSENKISSVIKSTGDRIFPL